MKEKKHLIHHPKDSMHASQAKTPVLHESVSQLMNLANQCGGKVVPPSVNAFRFQKDDMPYRP